MGLQGLTWPNAFQKLPLRFPRQRLQTEIGLKTQAPQVLRMSNVENALAVVDVVLGSWALQESQTKTR